jgi:hypothetical protein
MALAMVLLLVLLMGSMAAAAAMISSSSWVMSNYKDRQGTLAAVADAGVEEGRARVNGNIALYPNSGYTTLENGVTVTDASGNTIPGVRRWTYVGPIGMTTGQYGVFGSVVSVAEAGNGDRVIRRLEIIQESFAKYGYFTNFEGNIVFGVGDQLFGPVHSNDTIEVHSTGATFHGPVTSARIIVNPGNGDFRAGYTENVLPIAFPTTAAFANLRTLAAGGNTAFIADSTTGTAGQAAMRFEFINIDLNADGDAMDADEGFMRVYRHPGSPPNVHWVTGDTLANMSVSGNCGDYHGADFVPNIDHPFGGHNWQSAMNSATRRCFPGGDDRIWDGVFVAGPDLAGGSYIAWPGTPLPSNPALNARADKNYLFPLSRAFNPNFKGVVFVNGKVAISGTLRGRITLAATKGIIVIDDVKYATDPSTQQCKDILGLFSGTDVTMADNAINPSARMYASSSGAVYRTYDDTPEEYLHAVVLALDNFLAENHNQGSQTAQPCGSSSAGRGCLYLSGGVIQANRGAVGTAAGYGYVKRYAYDPCAFSDPPPYFPTTGRFARSRLLEIDPTGFDIAALFDFLTPDS